MIIEYIFFNLLCLVCNQVLPMGTYGIAKLRSDRCNAAQNKHPFVIFKSNSRDTFVGTASDVKNDPNIWHVTHLNEQKVFDYVFNYENGQINEPRMRWRTTIQRGMCGGVVSTEQLQPIISSNQWNARNQQRVRSLQIKVSAFLVRKLNDIVSNYGNNGQAIIQENQVCVTICVSFVTRVIEVAWLLWYCV